MTVQEMKDDELDTAVALALDYSVKKLEVTGALAYFDDRDRFVSTLADWRPSSDWSQGGPLIQYHRIDLKHKANEEWAATVFYKRDGVQQYVWVAWDYQEALVAAMRALVMSRLTFKPKSQRRTE